MNPLSTRTLPDLLKLATTGYRTLAMTGMPSPDLVDRAACRNLADELERRVPELLNPGAKFWWVSFSTETLVGRAFYDTVTAEHPFLLFKDWDTARLGIATLLDFREITAEEYRLHPEGKE